MLLQEFFDTIDASSHYIAAKSANLGETGIQREIEKARALERESERESCAFSKVPSQCLYIPSAVPLHSNCTRALTFENTRQQASLQRPCSAECWEAAIKAKGLIIMAERRAATRTSQVQRAFFRARLTLI